MLKNADLHSPGASAEDELKWHVVYPQSKSQYEQSLYNDAANRVVFKNCMEKCELTRATFKNFTKDFYYNQPE